MQVPWEGVIALLLYIISSTIGFVWWMATQTMKMQTMGEDLKEMKESVIRSEAIYARKEDIIKDFTRMEQQMNAVWRKLDKEERV